MKTFILGIVLTATVMHFGFSRIGRELELAQHYCITSAQGLIDSVKR